MKTIMPVSVELVQGATPDYRIVFDNGIAEHMPVTLFRPADVLDRNNYRVPNPIVLDRLAYTAYQQAEYQPAGEGIYFGIPKLSDHVKFDAFHRYDGLPVNDRNRIVDNIRDDVAGREEYLLLRLLSVVDSYCIENDINLNVIEYVYRKHPLIEGPNYSFVSTLTDVTESNQNVGFFHITAEQYRYIDTLLDVIRVKPLEATTH